eukprot:TRINITY_DN7068_c0_g1_i3.p1 TRINITY_DN7068_c0_g1~~TRINITY_DN7068_c0_g1_i3.p1  ORF type:complete len:432 (+),score=31.95 TRINITY_DN7068_c0_g1_i3:76-1296(+)
MDDGWYGSAQDREETPWAVSAMSEEQTEKTTSRPQVHSHAESRRGGAFDSGGDLICPPEVADLFMQPERPVVRRKRLHEANTPGQAHPEAPCREIKLRLNVHTLSAVPGPEAPLEVDDDLPSRPSGEVPLHLPPPATLPPNELAERKRVLPRTVVSSPRVARRDSRPRRHAPARREAPPSPRAPACTARAPSSAGGTSCGVTDSQASNRERPRSVGSSSRLEPGLLSESIDRCLREAEVPEVPAPPAEARDCPEGCDPVWWQGFKEGLRAAAAPGETKTASTASASAVSESTVQCSESPRKGQRALAEVARRQLRAVAELRRQVEIAEARARRAEEDAGRCGDPAACYATPPPTEIPYMESPPRTCDARPAGGSRRRSARSGSAGSGFWGSFVSEWERHGGHRVVP